MELRKLLYIPAVISFLAAIGSFCIATHALFWTDDNGTVALHIIFMFSDSIVGAILWAIASYE